MKYQSFKKTHLATSLSLALGAAAMSPLVSMAEEVDENVEVIQVKGIRGSLIKSTDIKRQADGVVDAISAEDIGKMPDTNLAESLQRITGVAIDRTNGEGSKITVRGFGPDYNVVTLNGRQMPAANLEATSAANSRSFDFANLAAESVSGVEVYKTSTAKLATGGIGSTINITTARPLDNPGLVASIGAKGIYDSSVDDGDGSGSKVTPEVSGIFSQTFLDDTVGIALTGSLSRRDLTRNTAETSSGWFTMNGTAGLTDDPDWGSLPTNGNFVNRPQEKDVYSVPRNLLYSFNDIKRERANGQVTLQWAPTDKLKGTLDYTYSEQDVETRRQEMSTWFNGNPVAGEYTKGTNTQGSVVGPVIYSDSTGADVGLGTGNWGTVNKNHSAGFNLEYLATDNLSFELDFHRSTAEAGAKDNRGSNNVISAVQFDRVGTTVDYSKDFPVMDIAFADGVAGLDPARMSTSGTSFRNSYNKSEIDQLQLSGEYVFDEGIVESIDFGVVALTSKNRSAFSNTQRDRWGGYGTPDQYPDQIFVQQDLKKRFSGLPGVDNPNLEPVFYSSEFNDLVQAISDVAAANGDILGPCGTILCADPNFSTDRRTKEEQTAAFLQANLAWDIADMPTRLILGVRYENTKVTADAKVPTYNEIVWSGDNEFTAQSTGEVFTQQKGDYSYFLPSFDFRINPMDDLVLRASFSQSITRPSYADIQGGQTINPLLRQTGGTGNFGNTNLKPFESSNYDLSAEWYYGEGSYVSAGYYMKDVKNFIGQDTFQDETWQLPHPGQGPRYLQAREAVAAAGGDPDNNTEIRQYFVDQNWVNEDGEIVGEDGDPLAVFEIFTPVNARKAKIDGFELALQHLFGESGFGLAVNYTKVNGDVKYDNYNTNKERYEGQEVPNQFVLLGLSDTFNGVFFYDQNAFQARIAYNWRDKFLTSTIDGNGERNPIYTDAYGQWDANVSYDFTENFSVFGEVINLTGEYQRLVGRHPNMIIAINKQAPRYHLGARYKF
ncbi:TonB-dependent receptor [Paraferrimonas sedimenticola]|uniref:TonB-dependent receptor n=1 Tax=Paraferrimonas sedimenticola TaxID=375674 RepID=A0AA37RYF7_9GAMM|nr:TonB-dependent receptor [Paraferrimonas sedimenticola]GLP97638.1 TonB-dependent receptor [Paraferrimonas sedimenticola]